MEKLKLALVKIWALLKRIGFYFKLAYIQTAAIIVRARRGEALEIHPAVSRWAIRIFRLIFVLAIFVFAIGVAFAIDIYKYKTSDRQSKFAARIIPFPAAVVQGRIVTVNDYFENYQYIEKFYSSTQQTGVDLGAIKGKVMDQLIDNQLLKSQAKKFNVSVTSSDIENAYSEVVTQNGGEQEVQKVLNDLYGLNIKQFKRLITDQLLEQKLSEAVPVQVKASHILIRVDQNAPADKIDAAKAKIDQVSNEIKGGADFAEEAKKFSEDTGSASSGGNLDFFSRGQMDPDFEKVAFETPVGQISAPFRTQFGWHIVKITDKKGKVDMSFSDWLVSLRKDSLVWVILNVKK